MTPTHALRRLLAGSQWSTRVPRLYSSSSADKLRATAISKARRATAAAATDPDDDVPMSQRVPLRKPSTGGLGVPGKIPSETSSLTRNRRLDGVCNEQQPSISNAEVGDANGATKGRQAHFGPIRRIDQEAARVKKEDDAKAYKERYQNAAKRWTSSIIAMPILLVTSWYLFDRLVLGNEPKTLQRDED